MKKLKFYQVIRPSFRGTGVPVYYYTFAENELDAQFKVDIKWGGIDDNVQVKELNDDEINNLVIATDYFG